MPAEDDIVGVRPFLAHAGIHDIEFGDELVRINGEPVGSLGRRALPRKLQSIELPVRYVSSPRVSSPCELPV